MNNSGLVRQLKRISKKTAHSDKPKSKNSSNLIAFIALIISGVSLYFQFFHEKYDLNASIIDAEIKNDTISLDLIYHNKGNQDATISSAEIFFYSDKNKSKLENHIEFINDKQLPYILSPGKQVFKQLTQKVYFNEKDLLENSKTRYNDTLRVSLRVTFLNENSLQSEKITECGWITLDSVKNIDYWYIKYQKLTLDSDEYFSSGYKPKKK
jgi:hypothetical protein